MFKTIQEDVHSVLERDPAARNALEVLLCYPGLHAIWAHRIAHKLWQGGFKLIARNAQPDDLPAVLLNGRRQRHAVRVADLARPQVFVGGAQFIAC